MKRQYIRPVCFLTIFIIVLLCWNSIFKFKYGDGIYSLTKFYQLEDNTVDVLVLGSSHAFENFNNGVLWDEYGMSSFVLGGSVQPMWNTYYYLKEALKTQTPKLIILEGYTTTLASDYSDDSRIIKNNYGLHWSIDKLNSLMVSIPRDRWKEFFLQYPQYHSRYKELNSADFLPDQGKPVYEDWKGFGCNMTTTPAEATDLAGVNARSDLHKKTEEYYRKTLMLAIEHNIPIIVVIAPYSGCVEGDQEIFNRAGDIASEYGIRFINLNTRLDDIGIDYSTDSADSAHLNYRGNQKFAKYIGKIVDDSYELPDRRDDDKYISWNRNAEFIRQMIYDQELVETDDLSEIIHKLHNPNYWIFVSVNGNCSVSDIKIQEITHNIGIESHDNNCNMWFVDESEHIQVRDAGINEEYNTSLGTHSFQLISKGDDGKGHINIISIDNEELSKVTDGLNVVVYDIMTEKVVDSFGVDVGDGYKMIR